MNFEGEEEGGDQEMYDPTETTEDEKVNEEEEETAEPEEIKEEPAEEMEADEVQPEPEPEPVVSVRNCVMIVLRISCCRRWSKQNRLHRLLGPPREN